MGKSDTVSFMSRRTVPQSTAIIAHVSSDFTTGILPGLVLVVENVRFDRSVLYGSASIIPTDHGGSEAVLSSI